MMDLPTKLAAKMPMKYNEINVRISPRKVIINSSREVLGKATPNNCNAFFMTGESVPPTKPKRNFTTKNVTYTGNIKIKPVIILFLASFLNCENMPCFFSSIIDLKTV